MLRADRLKLSNRGELDVIDVVFLHIVDDVVYHIVTGLRACLGVARMTEYQIKHLNSEALKQLLGKVIGIVVFSLDFIKKDLNISHDLLRAEYVLFFGDKSKDMLGYILGGEIQQKSAVQIGGVVHSVNYALWYKDNVTCFYAVGAVVDKVSAVTLLHIVDLIMRVIVLCGYAVFTVKCLAEIIISDFSVYLLFHVVPHMPRSAKLALYW